MKIWLSQYRSWSVSSLLKPTPIDFCHDAQQIAGFILRHLHSKLDLLWWCLLWYSPPGRDSKSKPRPLTPFLSRRKNPVPQTHCKLFTLGCGITIKDLGCKCWDKWLMSTVLLCNLSPLEHCVFAAKLVCERQPRKTLCCSQVKLFHSF